MNKNRRNIQLLTQGAIIAALYVALTVAFQPISFGAIQFRISEALTIMPLFTPAAVSGLFIGCLLANFLGGAVIIDIICGSLATLIGAVLGYLLRKNRWLVPIPTVIANTLIIPLVLIYGYGEPLPYYILALYLLAGETLGCYVLGEILAQALIIRKVFDRKKN